MSLELFPPGTSRRHRRRRLIAMCILLLASIALVWPVYGWFAGASPRILGLPLSLAWVVLWLHATFGVVLWLYWGDEVSAGRDDEGAR